MRKHLLILICLLPVLLFSQSKLLDTQSSKEKSRKDTIVIIKEGTSDGISKNYQEILEKTNNQLSLWWNPYGIFIATIGVLFAILAIVAAYVIYRQGKEYKDIIRESLDKHEAALNRLISERNAQLKLFQDNLNNLIEEHKLRLNSMMDDPNRDQTKNFITSLEKQRELVDSRIHTHLHSGWLPLDINEQYPVSNLSIFNAWINLNSESQQFIVYLKLLLSDGALVWLGFAGNTGKTDVGKTNDEYTVHQTYAEKSIRITTNIFDAFKSGFPRSSSIPVKLMLVRLRASNVDPVEIQFSYKVS